MAFTLAPTAPQTQDVDPATIVRGRQMVIEHGCGGCHGGFDNPAAEGWLAGVMSPAQEFLIGPCLWEPGAEPCWKTRPRNLTPDNTTGMGRFSERQIYNALRFGLRPGETADVEITSTTPGEGNFPIVPKYVAPPMPWTAWRHIADEDLWAIATYLKHGVKPVSNQVEDSEGPPDFWASFFVEETIGAFPAPPFPTATEVMPSEGSVDLDQVLRGRQMVVEHACGDCHGGFSNPASETWLAGVTAPFQVFPVGPCLFDPADPCFMMRPRNLTPDEDTGIGSYTERQIFNAIRHGLRPSGTPDAEIPAGEFPDEPDYLGPGMPWPEFRHMADEDIRAIAAYLKHGLRPVSNEVEDSDRPPEGWASEYEAFIGTHPAPTFPTRNEVGG
jgi:mono/diheme cytochrome c family protein